MTDSDSDFDFRDTANRVWRVPAINLSHLQKLNECGIDLDDMIKEGHLWSDTSSAKIACGVVLWHTCQGQHDVSEEDFFKAFDGATFDNAQEALAIRVANFSPKRKQGITEMLNLQEDIRTKTMDLAKSQMDLAAESMKVGSMEIAVVTQLEKMLKGKGMEKEIKVIAEALSENASSEPEKPELPTLANTA